MIRTTTIYTIEKQKWWCKGLIIRFNNLKKDRMKKLLYTLPLLLLFAIAFASDAPGTPVALITGTEGAPVVIKPATGTEVTLDQGAMLEEGDIVSLNSDSKVTIYFMDGEIVNLMPKQKLFVGKESGTSRLEDGTGQTTALQSGINAISRKNVNLTAKNDIDKELSSPASFRAEGVIPIAPAGLIISESPEFTWYDSAYTEATPVEKQYVLLVMDSKNKEIFRGTVKGMTNTLVKFTIPGVKFTQTDSKQRFKWDVYPLGKEPKLGASYDLAGVIIVADKKFTADVSAALSDIDKNEKIDEQSRLFLKGLILKDFKCYSDAIVTLDKLGSDSKVSKNILGQKAWLYARLGANGSFMVKKYAAIL